MNITINFHGDIYATFHGCPCPPFNDFDEDYEDEDFDEYDIENDEKSESDGDNIIGRLKADFSNLDALIESVPVDVAIAIAVKMGMELMKTIQEEDEDNAD